MTEREQIARIIEPEFFERGFEALVGAKMAHYQADALAKADQIIALRAPDALSLTPGEPERAEMLGWLDVQIKRLGNVQLRTTDYIHSQNLINKYQRLRRLLDLNPSVGVG